jgi:hypothetical protein
MLRRPNQSGSAILEFTLAGITLIFIWISVVQMAIGMWRYHTIQYAVKRAGSYASFHGSGCSSNGNTCSIQVKDVASVLKTNAIGVDPAAMTVTFNVMQSDHVTAVSGQTITCQLSGGGSPCLSNTTTWPPATNNAPGTDIEIKTEYQFQSALALWVPGQGGVTFGSTWLPGFTHQTILF